MEEEKQLLPPSDGNTAQKLLTGEEWNSWVCINTRLSQTYLQAKTRVLRVHVACWWSIGLLTLVHQALLMCSLCIGSGSWPSIAGIRVAETLTINSTSHHLLFLQRHLKTPSMASRLEIIASIQCSLWQNIFCQLMIKESELTICSFFFCCKWKCFLFVCLFSNGITFFPQCYPLKMALMPASQSGCSARVKVQMAVWHLDACRHRPQREQRRTN